MRRFALFVSLLASAAPAAAQPAAAPLSPVLPVRALSDSAEASLLTMLPGEEVYSLFGHSALRVRDPATGLDRTYNYGTFDFRQPLFVLRFVRGQLDYILDTAPFEREVARYQYLGRPMIEQRLALDPAVVRALYARLETNALPANREYRYDFFFDNCSTRLLDVVDAALREAGRPGAALPAEERRETFRDLIRPYAAADPGLWTGMTLGVGLPADRVATPRERTFLPLELLRQLDRATVAGRPLVAAKDTLFWVPGAGLPRPAFPWPVAAGWLACAVGVAGTVLGARRHDASHLRRERLLDAALLGAVGLVGLVLALLWLATDHVVTGPNLNLLWAWPTHLAAALLVARGRATRALGAYLLAAGAVAALTAAGWPFWPQALPAPALPLAVLLAVRSFARGLRVHRPVHPVASAPA